MGTAFLNLSSNALTISVTNNKGVMAYDSNYQYYKVSRGYSTTGGSIRATLPSNLQGKKITSIAFSATLTSNSGGAAWRYTTESSALELLNNGTTSFDISFLYAPSTDNATISEYNGAKNYIARGVNTKRASWSNISVEIQYEDDIIIDDAFGVGDCNTNQTSYALGEDIELSFNFTPAIALEANTLRAQLFSEENDNFVFNYILNNDMALVPDTNYNFSVIQTLNSTLDIDNLLNDIKVRIWNYNNPANFLEIPLYITIIESRIAPTLTASLNTTTFLTNVTIPVITLSNFSTDSNTDAYIQSIKMRFNNNVFPEQEIDFDSNTSTNTISLVPFVSTVDVTNLATSLIVTDSYAQTSSIMLGAINVYVYNAPTFSNTFAIQRYIENPLTGNNDITDEGSQLIVNGSVNFSSYSIIHKLTLVLNDIEYTFSNNPIVFNNDTSVFSTVTVNVDQSYTIRAIAEDDYTSTIIDLDIPAASGYFNIEEGGVAIGGFAHGTEDDKQFECYYPMYLYFNNIKYQIILGENNTLIANPIGGDSGGGTTPVSSLILYNSTGNLSYTGSDRRDYILTYTDGQTAYNWSVMLENQYNSTTISLKNEIVMTADSGTSTTYNDNVAITNGIIVPSGAHELKVNYTISRPSNSQLFLYYGFVVSGYNGLSPQSGITQGEKCIKTVTISSSGAFTDSFDISSYSWLLGNSYVPIIMFNARPNAAYAKLTINKVWFE